MIKDPKIFLQHILESIGQIEKYVNGIEPDEFLKSAQIQDAVIRRLMIIGEATKNLPLELREKYTAIPWNEIAGMRDVLIHEYFGTDTELVWRTIKNDLPIFKRHIEEILAGLSLSRGG